MLSENSLAPALYAGIDVGTNTVKMVIADLTGGGAKRIWEQSDNTRLGEGMLPHAPRLREAAMRRTLDALENFVAVTREYGVVATACVGTAALRDAENREEFLHRTQERLGLHVDVIPGHEEARLSYLAVRRDPVWRDVPHLRVIDIGGGSTEIIQGEPYSAEIAGRISINLGAVKLTERCLKSDPPTIAQLDAANREVVAAMAEVEVQQEPSDGVQGALVGVGGTLTNLGAMALGNRTDPEQLHGLILSADRLETQIEQLASLTIEARKNLPGLDSRRADIILGGAILLSQALSRLGAQSIQISTRGLRWGLLYDRFQEANA